MDDNALQILQNGAEDEVCKVLAEFNSQNAQTFTFPQIKQEIKQKWVEAVLYRLKVQPPSRVSTACLQALRILSRDKENLEIMTTDDLLKMMIRLAGLEYYANEQGDSITIQDSNHSVTVEAQKCLCNLIYQSTRAQSYCSKNSCTEGIVQRLKTYKDPELPYDVKFFDMRMLFLITALCKETRPRIRYELHGFSYLMELLTDLTCSDDGDDRRTALSDEEVNLCCEVLKILFNLTVSSTKITQDEEEEAHFMRLVSVLRDLLMVKTQSREKREEIQSHTINLLTNMPSDYYEELLTPLNEADVTAMDTKDIEYDGKNMEAILVLLDFLHRRLERPPKNLKETLVPILHCLCEASKNNRAIRKFCKIKVLPPLRAEEVKHLPEEGHTIRNRLCKLLTAPIKEVKDFVADFLYVLCKENVNRMVKYTGFGNCAGLLADRGLLLGSRSKGNYSSESEDSDLEEYEDIKDHVNPVTGRWEEEKPSPMEGMSEEQKEYEAMKLVSVMDQLQRQGVIQPSRIGEDGRPQPIEHILELAESLPQVPAREASSDTE